MATEESHSANEIYFKEEPYKPPKIEEIFGIEPGHYPILSEQNMLIKQENMDESMKEEGHSVANGEITGNPQGEQGDVAPITADMAACNEMYVPAVTTETDNYASSVAMDDPRLFLTPITTLEEEEEEEEEKPGKGTFPAPDISDNFSVPGTSSMDDSGTFSIPGTSGEFMIPGTSGIKDLPKSLGQLLFEHRLGPGSQDHESKNDDSEVLFRCLHCNYTTNTKRYLGYHNLKHSDVKRFKCTECDYSTNRKYIFMNHLLKHSGIKRLKCTHCDYATNLTHNLKTHLMTHAEVKKFQCPQCDYGTNHKLDFGVHLLTHAGVKLLQCPACDYSTNKKSSLSSHLLKHSSIKKHKCPRCTYETNIKRDLTYHLLKHKCTSKVEDDEKSKEEALAKLSKEAELKKFKCNRCNYATKRKRNLKVHALRHIGEQPYPTLECGCGPNQTCNMEAHIMNHPSVKRFKCSECSYGTSLKNNYAHHLLTHTSAKLFKCTECSYGTNRKRDLMIHSVKHSQPAGECT